MNAPVSIHDLDARRGCEYEGLNVGDLCIDWCFDAGIYRGPAYVPHGLLMIVAYACYNSWTARVVSATPGLRYTGMLGNEIAFARSSETHRCLEVICRA